MPLPKRNIPKPGQTKKIPCPNCDGDGIDMEQVQDSLRTCKECGGKGFLEAKVVTRGEI